MKPIGTRSRIALLLLFLGISAFGAELSAGPGSKVKASEVIALDRTGEERHGVEIIAWSGDGSIYFLDSDLNLVKQISPPPNETWVRDVIQVPDGLLMFAGRETKTGEMEVVLIQYDIAQGRELKRWSNPKHAIWSIAATDHGAVAISFYGVLWALGPNGLEKMAEYPGESFYLPIAGTEPIICTGPDLSKLNWTPPDLTRFNWRPGVCYREGEFNWKKEGGWLNTAPPFVCGDYLVEKHIHKKVGVGIGISVTDVATGRQVSDYTPTDISAISALTCAGTDMIYALVPSIIIRDLPNW